MLSTQDAIKIIMVFNTFGHLNFTPTLTLTHPCPFPLILNYYLQ